MRELAWESASFVRFLMGVDAWVGEMGAVLFLSCGDGNRLRSPCGGAGCFHFTESRFFVELWGHGGVVPSKRQD